MMNISTRIKNIEQKVLQKNDQGKLVIVTESSGKYYLEKDGQQLEVKTPDCDSNKLIIIVKSYLNYEMQKNLKQ